MKRSAVAVILHVTGINVFAASPGDESIGRSVGTPECLVQGVTPLMHQTHSIKDPNHSGYIKIDEALYGVEQP